MLECLIELIGDLIDGAGDFPLPDPTVINPEDLLQGSIDRVSEGLGIPAAEAYTSIGSYGEFLANDPTNPFDDMIGADPNAVVGINAKYGHPHAYDVITAHEMGHAQISASGLEDKLTPYCQEALSDVQAGVYAGANGLPQDVYEGEIRSTGPDLEHPAGDIRCDIFNRAYEIGRSGCNPVEYSALVSDVLGAFQAA